MTDTTLIKSTSRWDHSTYSQCWLCCPVTSPVIRSSPWSIYYAGGEEWVHILCAYRGIMVHCETLKHVTPAMPAIDDHSNHQMFIKWHPDLRIISLDGAGLPFPHPN